MKFFVNAKEPALIKQKLAQIGTKNLSAYLRKMAIGGFAIKPDIPELRELAVTRKRISNNENQIAKRLNKTGHICDADIEEIEKNQEELYAGTRTVLESLAALPR